MKTIYLIQYGIGQIGRSLLNIMLQENFRYRDRGIKFVYTGIADRSGLYIARKGIEESSLFALGQNDRSVLKSLTPGIDVGETVADLRLSGDAVILIDLTASAVMQGVYLSAMRNGAHVVTANKRPLCGSCDAFSELCETAIQHQVHLRYESTVGAGLPVIQTLNSLLSTGDEIISITGCFSGTLGYIASALERDIVFSQAVREARDLGYTEPDPRSDLTGEDVARKALILSRLLGSRVELDSIVRESWYPSSMDGLPAVAFLDQMGSLDEGYRSRSRAAKEAGEVLRYVAKVTPGRSSVGISEVARSSMLGQLSGPDNMAIFRTRRYDEHPLVISGPGAGAAVTAAGVLSDIIFIAGLER